MTMQCEQSANTGVVENIDLQLTGHLRQPMGFQVRASKADAACGASRQNCPAAKKVQHSCVQKYNRIFGMSLGKAIDQGIPCRSRDQVQAAVGRIQRC